MTPDAPALEEVLTTVFDVFKGHRTAWMEQKARQKKLPNLQPKRRVLGSRVQERVYPDGSKKQEKIDVVYDFPLVPA